LFHESQGGSGILLGGLADSEPGNVVVLGAGQAGSAAAELAAQVGAAVTVMDINPEKLNYLKQDLPDIHCLSESGETLSSAVASADLLVGAIMVAGAKAPQVVSEEQVAAMRPGSVVVDIAIDQGGCIATSRATDYDNPVYLWQGVQHCCVTNLPGAVPRTASQVLSANVLPHLRSLLAGHLDRDTALQTALNIQDGNYQHHALIRQYVD